MDSSPLVSRTPSGSLYELDLGLRLFWCQRWNYRKTRGDHGDSEMRSFGPAPLSRGRIAFAFFEKGNWTGILNGDRETYHPGHMMVACGGDSCGWTRDGRGTHSKMGLGLVLKQGEVANVLLHRKFRAHYVLARPREFVSRFNQLLKALAEPLAVREWAVGGALLSLVATILKETAPPFRRGGEEALSLGEKIRSAQAWANARLATRIGLAEWAQSVGLRVDAFERVFKEESGVSAKHWLETQRLQMARQYLLSTGNSIQQIADAVGYHDAFYFSRVFHKRFGQSPLQFRKAGVQF